MKRKDFNLISMQDFEETVKENLAYLFGSSIDFAVLMTLANMAGIRLKVRGFRFV